MGLVPRESSAGDKQQRVSITQAGSLQARALLVQAAQTMMRGSIRKHRRCGSGRKASNHVEENRLRLWRWRALLVSVGWIVPASPSTPGSTPSMKRSGGAQTDSVPSECRAIIRSCSAFICTAVFDRRDGTASAQPLGLTHPHHRSFRPLAPFSHSCIATSVRWLRRALALLSDDCPDQKEPLDRPFMHSHSLL